MKGTFTEIIYGSWEWTKTVLFRPFHLKKWIFLCIITILAMEFSGCNININVPTDRSGKQQTVQTENAPQITDNPNTQDILSKVNKVGDKISTKWILFLVLLVIIAAIGLLILAIWIYSRFSFVFLSAIVNNDASIRTPFRETSYMGNSFFKWNILVLLFFCTTVILWGSVLAGSLYLSRNVHIAIRILFVITPWIFIALLILVGLGIVSIIARDLVLAVIYKYKIGILSGWRKIIPVIKREKTNLIIYILIKTALRILSAILGGFFSFAVMFALLIPASITFGLLYLTSTALPTFLIWGYYAVLILLAIVCIVTIIVIVNFILLPIPVYFRTFSLKFLARLDDRYDLFKLIPLEEAE